MCSAEDLSGFGGDNIYSNRGDAETDFVTLSECDYVIGPPSTFSNSASFCGENTRITIEDPELFINGEIDLRERLVY